MFGFSGEHLLVLLVILLVFGPKRLPDLGHSLGRTLKNFKDAVGGGRPDGPAAPETSTQRAAPPPAQIHAETVAEAEKTTSQTAAEPVGTKDSSLKE